MPDKPDVQELICRLPCSVRLPEEWIDFFDHTGPLPGDFSEQRRFPRFYCRTEGALLCRPSLPVVPREQKCHRVYVKDISRSSIAFLAQRAALPLRAGRHHPARRPQTCIHIVRCHKIGDDCYDTAGQFADVE